MTAEHSPPDAAGSATDTDAFFGLVVGVYAATLVVPAVSIAVALRVPTDPGVLFFLSLGVGVAVTAAVGRIAGRTPLAVRLGGSRWVWTAMALPFLYFGVLPLGTTFARGDALPGGMVAVALVGAIAGFLSGVGVVAASRNRHAKAMVADAETVVRFAASAPARDRRVTTWAVAGLFGAAILGFVGSALLDFAPLRWLFQLLVPAGTALYGTTTERRVTISDAGIVVATPAYKHLRSWSAYESFDVTDEEIVVRRAGWSPWGLRDFRRDATEVEDPRAVAATLERFLPRE
ncbi:hypothetical protein [Halorussus caseinilyticus]|uniref:hypothetical protein n=1 Tax=Halorussus caseinilyticus TaxID=3034025 RepID=UPI0023E8C846|nr:hypothetical protein [Halorussus sp. DT72]